MDIILKEDVANLGYKNDVVKVKNGYGRNYLIPNGLAEIATSSARKMMEETLKQSAHKEEKQVKEAEGLSEKLAKAKIAVVTKAGEKGKIFGSVNNIQLAASLKELGFDIERKNIELQDAAIKKLGTYKADIKLYKDIKVTIDFEVLPEVTE